MAFVRLHSTRDFFRIWFSWKTNAVIVFFVIVGLIMSFSYIYTPDYESTAKIVLLPRTSEGALVSVGDDETRVLKISMEDINTEIELLTSKDVIRDTVKSFTGKAGLSLKIQSTAWYDHAIDYIKKAINEVLIFLGLKERLSPFDVNVKLLGNSLTVEPVAMSNVILVTLTAERPRAAVIVLNRLLDVYVRHHNRSFTKEGQIKFFDEQASRYRKKLGDAEKKLKKFQEKWDIVDLKKQNDANIEFMLDLNQKLKQTEVSCDEITSRVIILRKALAENDHDIVITKEMRTIPSIINLENHITSCLVKRSEIIKNFTPSSREYGDIQNQIRELRGELKTEIAKAVNTDELEIEILLKKQASLKKRIAELQEEANSLNQKENMLNELKRDVDLFSNNYMLYASKTEEARIYTEREKHDLANISIADRASIPVEPAFPNRLLMLVISVVVGLFGALGIPFLLEFLDHRLKNAEEVEALLDLPVICSFPEIKSGQF